MFVLVTLAAGAVTALIPGLLASLFPTEVRQSGYALPCNMGAAVFAGPAQLILAAAGPGLRHLGGAGDLCRGRAIAVVSAVALRSQPRFFGTGSVALDAAGKAAMRASQAPAA